MKHLYPLLVLVFTFQSFYSKSQSQSGNRKNSTTLIVIGSKHNGNVNLSQFDLLKAIKKIKPDIILLEGDSSLFNKCDFNLKPPFYVTLFNGILDGFFKLMPHFFSIEFKAAMIYKDKHPFVCLSGYDIYHPKRNELINEYSKLSPLLWNKVDSLSKTGSFNKADSIWLSEYNMLSKYVNIVAGEYNLFEMNQKPISDSIKKQMISLKDYFEPIILKYPQLSEYANSYINSTKYFHYYRNEEICKKIRKAILEEKGKKILVLTGLAHKYFIMDYFQNSKDINVSVKEYYEF